MQSPTNLVLFLALGTVAVLLLFVARNPPWRRSAGFRAGDYDAKPLLSRWELAALAEMRRELPCTLHICPQVRLADLVSIRPVEPGERRAALNRVASKSVDFVVIDAAGRPLLVVELDDRTHDRPDRRERDRLVDAVLGQSGIPVRRVRPGQAVAVVASLAGAAGLVPPGPGELGRQKRGRVSSISPAS